MHQYLKSMLFDISIIYNFAIFFIPVILTLVNLVYLFATDSNKMLLSFLPLIIPILSSIIIKIRNNYGHKTYLKFKEYSKELILIANKKDIDITSNDVRIRIKPKKNVSIIFDVYSNRDETNLLKIIEELQRFINSSFKEYTIELLIDKKKDLNNNTPFIQLT